MASQETQSHKSDPFGAPFGDPFGAPFGDRLAAALAATKTPLCMGIDPHKAMMTPLFCDAAGTPSLSGLRDFALTLVDAATGLVPAIKPQAAMFEAYGPEGVAILAETAKAAQAAGLLVIMDAKRGDIGSTSEAYANAYLGADAPFPSDALTINPWMGLDTLAPFMTRAKQTNSGLFILVRTSNKGAADLQEQTLVGGHLAYQQLAHDLAPLIEDAKGTSGLSSFGIVAGATVPEQAEDLRKILPSAPFLIPGFGAQGAGPAHATIALGRSDNSFTGGLVNSSRGIIFCEGAQKATSLPDYKQAVKDAIKEQTALLQTAL